MNWLKQTVGLSEPEYGPSAIQTVTRQCDQVPFTESTRDDLKWHALDTTCVETHTFYVTTDSGHIAMAQVIYNCLAGIRTTVQFNCKVFYPKSDEQQDRPPLWVSDTLDKWALNDDKSSAEATNFSMTLADDASSYSIKSSTNTQAIIDITFSKLAPGIVAGKDGTSYYGTDPQKPWGRMSHVFWPRCRVSGSILTQQGELNVKGQGCFIHALQGMRPNLAASSWNFVNFQSPTYSAIMMEFTTPPSYGSTSVTVGAVAIDDKILCAGAQDHVAHTSSTHDAEVGWPEPQSASFKWKGSNDNVDVSADLSGSLGTKLERVDVLAQIPAFLKFIIAQAAGSKPYIYQFGPRLPLKLKIGDEHKEEEGSIFMEATFIS